MPLGKKILSVTLLLYNYSAFESNFTAEGGVIYATSHVYMYMQDVTMSNNAANLGIMYFIESICTIFGHAHFTANM